MMRAGRLALYSAVVLAGVMAVPSANAQAPACAGAAAYEAGIAGQLYARGCGAGGSPDMAACRRTFRELVRAERARDRACALGARPRNAGGFFNNFLSDGAGFVLGGW